MAKSDDDYYNPTSDELRRAHTLPTAPEGAEARLIGPATPVGPRGTGGERGEPKTEEIQPQVAPEGVVRRAR